VGRSADTRKVGKPNKLDKLDTKAEKYIIHLLQPYKNTGGGIVGYDIIDAHGLKIQGGYLMFLPKNLRGV
jgi:hypothetical protein